MTSAVRPKPRTTTKARSASARNADSPHAPPSRALAASPVNQLELVGLLHKSAVIEIVIPEVEPGRYQVHLVVAWRYGRSVLTGASGQPRTFRSLDTLRTHLKTLGIGSTLVRLELLP
ncbi:hypothetical protein WKW77_29530 [Variovorax ureilyticus]|uniref:Uncharacterized protein n=1 Tax=Variovorax ureilyticus TaxID=1836198 RepID=A0ABU8VNL8_9BURK